jgi:hypothetical protein
MPLVRFILSKYSKIQAKGWNDALAAACRGLHREIVDFLICNGANDWNGGLSAAAVDSYHSFDSNKLAVLSLMLMNGADAATCFRIPADANLLYDLVTSTQVCMAHLRGVAGIDLVFARCRAAAAVVADSFNERGFPLVLLRLILDYSGNMCKM